MNELLNISSAQYVDVEGDGVNDHIDIMVNGITTHVPLDPANRHYAEIMRQVEAGTLTIADAD